MSEVALEDVEAAAWAEQYAGLDPELRGIAVRLLHGLAGGVVGVAAPRSRGLADRSGSGGG